MQRILSVWLPSWPTLRLRRLASSAPDKPLATVETVRGLRRLAAVCPLAEAEGLSPGQALTEARAICPALEVVDDDPAADRTALAALAAWCERYTPLAAPDPPDGIFLDITGCGHFFLPPPLRGRAGVGGSHTEAESTLATDLSARLERNNLPCRIAIAGTPGAAWALARSATARGTCTILPPGQEKAALSPLPVALLRLEPRTIASLRRLGLKSIGELARQPRTEITGRFGPLPMLRLDQATGAAAEAIAWPRPPAPWAERLAFAEPIGTPEDLARALDRLAQRLCARLEAGERGAHRFTATFFRVDDERQAIAIATARPVRDAAYVTKLLKEKLEKIDPGFGIDAIALEAGETAPLAPPQRALAELHAPARPEPAATIDALANRLGPQRVWRAAPQESHVPERSVRRIPPLAPCPAWQVDPSVERPLRLLRRPEPIEATAPVPDDPPILFRWRGALHRVRAAAGPERIAAEWWRCTPGQGRTPDETLPESDQIRDYYRVEDTDGARFWIFRAGLDGTPRWFLHGLFA
jgi:protein ImuB